MSFFSSFLNRRPPSNAVAKDRLQILLAHDRGNGGTGDSALIQQLHREILEVLKRHLDIDQDKVSVKLDRDSAVSMLEIDIEVPRDKDS